LAIEDPRNVIFGCQTLKVYKRTEKTHRSQSEPRHSKKATQTDHMANSLQRLNPEAATELLDDHRALEPPDPIPNSAVKRRIADGSVGSPHVRVGHHQASTPNPRSS